MARATGSTLNAWPILSVSTRGQADRSTCAPTMGAPDTSVSDLFDAFRPVQRDDALYERNLNAIMDRLLKTHGMPLSGQEINGVRVIYRTFGEREFTIRQLSVTSSEKAALGGSSRAAS